MAESDFDAPRAVPDTLEPLILDLLEWIGPHGRPYAEVLAAWRTSCPRLPVWEEANARGYLDEVRGSGPDPRILVSAEGTHVLAERRRSTAPGGS